MRIVEAIGVVPLLVAIAVNGVGNTALLLGSDWVSRRVSPGAMRAVGKVMGLMLAAMAISMLRIGVTNALRDAGFG